MVYLVALILGISLSFVVFFGMGVYINTNQITNHVKQSEIEGGLASLHNVYNQTLSYGVFMNEEEWETIYSSFDKIPNFEKGNLNYISNESNYFCIQYNNITKNDINILEKVKDNNKSIMLSNTCTNIGFYEPNLDNVALSLVFQ